MKLTHTRDNGLAGFLIGLYAEGRVFFSKFLKTNAELVEVFLSLRLYSDTDHRFGEFHCLKNDRMVLIAESITGTDIFEAYTCTDITAADLFFSVLFVRVHLEQT